MHNILICQHEQSSTMCSFANMSNPVKKDKFHNIHCDTLTQMRFSGIETETSGQAETLSLLHEQGSFFLSICIDKSVITVNANRFQCYSVFYSGRQQVRKSYGMHIYKADVCNSAREMYVRHNSFRNEAYLVGMRPPQMRGAIYYQYIRVCCGTRQL